MQMAKVFVVRSFTAGLETRAPVQKDIGKDRIYTHGLHWTTWNIGLGMLSLQHQLPKLDTLYLFIYIYNLWTYIYIYLYVYRHVHFLGSCNVYILYLFIQCRNVSIYKCGM